MIAKWAKLVGLMGSTCDFVKGLAPEADVDQEVSTLFFGKPASTLAKRASSLSLYVAWAEGAGRPAFPLSELQVYEYFLDLSVRDAPASRAFTFRETVAFVMGFFGAHGAQAVLDSRRVLGAAHRCSAKGGPLREVPPLPTVAVLALERAAAGDAEEATEVDVVLAGFAAFCVHAQASWGMRCGSRRSRSWT